MNLSGISVQALLDEFDADPQRDMIVLYDDLDLPLGTLADEGTGKRLPGIMARDPMTGALSTDEWLRLRIGVGSETVGLESVRGAAARITC